EFLERVVGVRWYWPGDVGRMVSRHEEGIVLDRVCWQGAPTFAVRVAFDCCHLDPGLRPEDPWIWWQRMRWGGIGDGAMLFSGVMTGDSDDMSFFPHKSFSFSPNCPSPGRITHRTQQLGN
ncbi:MAG: hypothetical protein V1912_11150, partial [bacterium]